MSNFSQALEWAKEGKKICREGWDHKDCFIYMVAGSNFTVNRAPLNTIYPEGTPISYRPHLDARNADGGISVWAPSQNDLFAEDWQIHVDLSELFPKT